MDFWNRLGLRTRILLTLGGLVIITVVGGAVMIGYTYRIESLLTTLIRKDVASLQAAKGLETALLNQRGYVSYYFLDGDPHWLEELTRYRQDFDDRFNEARRIDTEGKHRQFLDRIEAEYQQYIDEKDSVIELYRSGQREAGAELHRQMRSHFFDILNTIEGHVDIHSKDLSVAWERSRVESRRLRIVAATAMSAAVILGAALSFVLVIQILEPIRRLAIETGGTVKPISSGDEVAALKRGVRGLIEDIDYTHSELERSRERLVQSEKMALVGKLAAEVAHSIRNPMTSINMRLFSLSRTLDLLPTQREDFEVIYDEMRHLDNIVRNFLEFSRPPKLKVQKTNVSEVVDMAVQLLEKRLERHGVTVERERGIALPDIDADPELLKEVLVNLIVNACDAMPQGGKLTIAEEDALAEKVGRAVLIRATDTGPGIPEAIRDRIMEPFFSTKEEGTGLGLSIAARIVEEHGGHLDVRSEAGKGATFIVTLPVREEEA
ncbi:MAG: histidine kinase [Candidatus Abyssobacteria bacterium SURF_17]|uniref:histidine kinase n=1 Tax=Candidatus Abyssobacteria bacterium SURF_17 TaxID=2093361 RepID=A0A419EWL6_9BACT|nr:MAG: histidine kinase [Candidatus Abyssubacteria bacterium SURF_17]